MMEFSEMIKRLEKAFPGFDIGSVGKVIIGNAKHPLRDRLAWEIVIAEPEVEK